MVRAERGHRVVQVVEAVEERDVRSPDALRARHRFPSPGGDLLEDEAVTLPRPEILRTTAGEKSRRVGLHAGGEDVVRIALPDDAGVMHGSEIAAHERV